MIYYLFIIKSVVNYICECSASYENPLRRNVYIPPNKDFIFLKKFENINVTTRILNFYEKNSMLDNVCTNSNYYYIVIQNVFYYYRQNSKSQRIILDKEKVNKLVLYNY
jgi:hypothetical protein